MQDIIIRKRYTPWRRFLAWTGFLFWFAILPISIYYLYQFSTVVDLVL